ncbi:Collagen adhesin precursor [Bifidobacterium sp. DSM 109960]|uniref:Collagen adhesin n=2 Tax=Bifidobacterium erythrocebi TaxID=2675325 RepID=A0A7Y0ES43_9BIFI|nr:Collagen adhesin precursor [Bifidobacterium sp. DSM 109960]
MKLTKGHNMAVGTGISAWARFRKHLAAVAVCLAACAGLFLGAPAAGTAFAAETTANGDAAGNAADGRITLEYRYQGNNVVGATVSLYRVADWNGKGTFSLTGAFSGVDYDWDGLMGQLAASTAGGHPDASAFQTAATTLGAYAKARNIEPTRNGVIYDSGASFGGLGKGLYLIMFDRYADTQVRCGASASLVSLPFNDSGNLVSEVTVQAKNDCVPAPHAPKTTRLSVRKVWNKDDARSRPSSITVTLLKDGTPAGTVALTAAGGWKHSWTGLSGDHDWTAVETSVPDGYTVAIDRNGTDLTITNTGGGHAATNGNIARTGVDAMPVVLAVMAAAAIALPVLIVVKARRE